jgi:SAM-dependent methyltransferase
MRTPTSSPSAEKGATCVQHFYEQIPGWFDWQPLYERWARELPDAATIVEVGVFKGRSFAFLGVEAINSGKARRLFAVDTWEGSPEHQQDPDVQADRLFGVFSEGVLRPLRDARWAGAPVQVRAIPRPSVQAAADFADGEADAVFIDGAHDRKSVAADLRAWWPKVKPGGELAGHDFDWPSVRQAVAPFAFSVGALIDFVSPRSWVIRKPAVGRRPQLETPFGARRALVTLVCNDKIAMPHETIDALVALGWGDRVTDTAEALGFEWIRYRRESSTVRVDDLRDVAVMEAKRAGATHLVFLDSDNVWSPDVLRRLLAHHDKGIVSGLYFARSFPHKPIVYRRAEEQDPDMSTWYVAIDDILERTGLVEADAIGMGCALIPMAVFDHGEFPRPWFLTRRDIQGTHGITEDMHFCEQAKALGYPILADPTILVEHVRSVRVGARNYVTAAARVEEAKAYAAAQHAGAR